MSCPNRVLEAQGRFLQKELFGRKSQKHAEFSEARQLEHFNEAEALAERPSEGGPVVVPEHTRRKFRRKPLPENLPRVEVIHDLDEAEKRGCLQMDAFSAYDGLHKQVRLVGCFAHVRRDFVRVIDARGKGHPRTGSVEATPAHVRTLYALEKAGRQQGLSPNAKIDQQTFGRP